MRAAVYLRQSEDTQGQQWGIERQREDVLRYIEARGWTVIDEFPDNDVSATKNKPRPQFNKMLSRLDEFDVIVARHMDRLLRKLSEFVSLLEVCDQTGVAIITTADGIDTSTDGGRTAAGILASVAEGEMRRKSARQKSAAKQAAKQGRWIGGKRPFGYLDGALAPHPEEAKLVREAYRSVLAGESLYSIAKRWNEDGVKTTDGNTWAGHTVRQMLVKPRYAGLRTYGGDVVGPAQWEPIVDEELWQSAHAILTAPGRQLAPPARKHLLSGILLCGKCSKAVGAAFNLHYVYKCKHCGGVSRQMAPIDNLAIKLILGFMATDEAKELLIDRSREDVVELVEREKVLEEKIRQLGLEWARDLMTPVQVKVATDTLTEELGQIRAQLRRSARARAIEELVCENPGPIWARWSLDRRRLAIREIVELTLLPGRKGMTFKPEHLAYRWLVAED
ncbi:hypothetical protein A5747_13745 [Mycobacterium sp. IS-836]|uniref:recombinase family protein n=1 Tax=Mycobacterium sp. IS-836 TaxID=1834160 RepID=UPI00096F3CAE|nr:recombinase family protein [Mycobacterium sp. IS-836]OMC55447.1 hypothetical protein A5747_13745 [Mycobacterium sp. IS-836]